MTKSIYLVLDMQNDLVHDEGPSGKGPLGEQVRIRNIIENTARVLEKARSACIAVGFVRVGFSESYHECPPSSPIFSAARENGIFKLGQWGTETHPKLIEHPGDVQVIKHRVSPFYSTTLEAQLKALGITHIYCSGVSTQAVVQATVRDAHDRDYAVTVVEDCCAAHSNEEHQNSIKSLARFCNLTSSKDVIF